MMEVIWNGVRLTLRQKSAELDGSQIPMPRMERKLLLFLLEHPDTVISRERLLLEVWDYGTPGATRTVDTHIKNLRAHLGKAGESIRTVRGVGYCLEGRPDWLCCKCCA